MKNVDLIDVVFGVAIVAIALSALMLISFLLFKEVHCFNNPQDLACKLKTNTQIEMKID
jgi:hypothetical protein